MPPRRPPPPESYGPAVETAAGGLDYSQPGQPTVYVSPPRPAAERDRDMATYRDGCPRCAEIPAELLGALVAALRAAKAGGAR